MTQSLNKVEGSQRQFSPSISDSRGIEIYNSPSAGRVSETFSNDVEKLIGGLVSAAKATYQLSDDAMRRIAVDHIVQYEEAKRNIMLNPESSILEKKEQLSAVVYSLNEAVANKVSDNEKNKQIYDDVFTNKVRIDYSEQIGKLDIEQNKLDLNTNLDNFRKVLSIAPYTDTNTLKDMIKTNIGQGQITEDEVDAIIVKSKIDAINSLYLTDRDSVVDKDGNVNLRTIEKYLGDYVYPDNEGKLQFKTDNVVLRANIAESARMLEDRYLKDIDREFRVADEQFNKSMMKAIYSGDMKSVMEAYTSIASGKRTDITDEMQFKWFNTIGSMLKPSTGQSKESASDQINLFKALTDFGGLTPDVQAAKALGIIGEVGKLDNIKQLYANIQSNISNSDMNSLEKEAKLIDLNEKMAVFMDTINQVTSHSAGTNINAGTNNPVSKNILNTVANAEAVNHFMNGNYDGFSVKVKELGDVPKIIKDNVLSIFDKKEIGTDDIKYLSNLASFFTEAESNNDDMARIAYKDEEFGKYLTMIKLSTSGGVLDQNKLINIKDKAQKYDVNINQTSSMLMNRNSAVLKNVNPAIAKHITQTVAFSGIISGQTNEDMDKALKNAISESIKTTPKSKFSDSIPVLDVGGVANLEMIDRVAGYLLETEKATTNSVQVNPSNGDLTLYLNQANIPVYIKREDLESGYYDKVNKYFTEKEMRAKELREKNIENIKKNVSDVIDRTKEAFTNSNKRGF